MNIYQGYNAYVTYLAVRQHFTSDYDYFKYNGKVKANQDSFLKRRDKFFFAKIDKKYDKKELLYFFVSNFVDHEDVWSGNLVSDKSEHIFNEWKKRIQSLAYNFKEQCETLFDEQFDEVFEVQEYSHPLLLRKFMQREVQPETMVILDDVLGYIKRWDKDIDEEIIWPKIKQQIVNYKPFMSYDKDRYKNILKKVVLSR